MSQDLVGMMNALDKNLGIRTLIGNDVTDPFKVTAPSSILLTRLHPYPFDIEATTLDGTFIRIYYNQGSLDEKMIITDAQVHIDIICSRNLWLIHDEIGRSSIRPYEIMSRVIDTLGLNGLTTPLSFDGYQHLYINTKFDCIRLYANHFKIETQ